MGEVGAERAAPLGAVDQLGDELEQAGLGRPGGGGAGDTHAHGVAQAAVGGQKRAGLLQVVGEGVWPGLSLGPECAKVWECFTGCSADPRVG
jgi:hypothetical protein